MEIRTALHELGIGRITEVNAMLPRWLRLAGGLSESKAPSAELSHHKDKIQIKNAKNY